jgi:tetratricopeptide (TPR) repeat protein
MVNYFCHGGQMKAKRWRITLIFALFFAFSSCSVFSFKRSQDPNAEKTKSNEENAEFVSKKDYEELKARYDSLLQASQNGTGSTTTPSQDLLSDLSSAKGSESFQTVDVFSDYPQETSKGTVGKSEGGAGSTAIDQEMAQLSKITALLGQRDFDNAMNLLKPLENSKIKQVQTQAKFLLAESLFLQNEFDLAMQVYEEIIRKDAYSSLVLRSLGRLIVCAEKLKIDEKKEKYYSLLHDFFEAS